MSLRALIAWRPFGGRVKPHPRRATTRITGAPTPSKLWDRARGVVENMNSRESEIPILFKKSPIRSALFTPVGSRARDAAASFASNDALTLGRAQISMALFKIAYGVVDMGVAWPHDWRNRRLAPAPRSSQRHPPRPSQLRQSHARAGNIGWLRHSYSPFRLSFSTVRSAGTPTLKRSIYSRRKAGRPAARVALVSTMRHSDGQAPILQAPASKKAARVLRTTQIFPIGYRISMRQMTFQQKITTCKRHVAASKAGGLS